jgi:hypothetical protein
LGFNYLLWCAHRSPSQAAVRNSERCYRYCIRAESLNRP